MKRHLATALGALLLCLAGPALGQMPKGPGGPIDVMPMPKVIDLAINKRANGPVVAGQAATFVVEVTNNGNVTVNSGMGIQVIDPLPAGFSGPMTGFGSPWSCGQVGASLICNWNGGPVAAGSPFPPITVTAVAGDRDSFRQCASVRIRQGQDMRPENNNDCVDGRIERRQRGRFDVAIRKDGPPTVPIGQTATFTLQVTNQGPSPVDGSVGLTVSDLVPVNFTNVTANGVGWNCTLAGSQPTQVTCIYTGSQVNAGLQFPTIIIKGTLEKEGPWLNCAEADFAKAEDSNPRDNRDCAEGRAGPDDKKGYDLGIRKTYKPPSRPGGPATFILYPFNNGPSAVSGSTGVQVTDTLPSNFQPPITGVGTNWDCSTNGGPPWTVVCDYTGPSVGPGSLPPIEISAAVREPGKFKNCAEILVREGRDLNPRDNRSCVDGEVSGEGGKRPDVNITKTALKQPWAWPSGTGVYQFRITNVGDTAVPAGHTFTLTENLPAGMVLVSTPNAWSCSPGAGTVGAATVICTYVSTVALNPTAFIQFDMTVGFDGRKEPRYQNCASVTVGTKDRPWAEVNLDNNTDCEPVEVSGGGGYIDIGIDKTGPSYLTIGQTGTYTLSVVNASTTPLDLIAYTAPPFVTVYTPVITVTDTLPAIFNPPATASGGPNWNCTVNGLTISCTYTGGGIIPPSGLLPPITVSATVGSPGSVENCAAAAIGGAWFIADMTPANNTACVSTVVRDPVKPFNLEAAKSQQGAWTATGGKFRISATNTTTNAIPAGTLLTFVDTVPAGLRFDSETGPFTCTPVGLIGPGTVTCTLTLTNPLPASATVSSDLTFSYVGVAEPNYQNCITLTASVTETTLIDNSDCASVHRGTWDISMVKRVVPGPWTYPAGGQFEIIITNTGALPLPPGAELRLQENIPNGMVWTGISGGWTCVPGPTATYPTQPICTLPLPTGMTPGQVVTSLVSMSFTGPMSNEPYVNCAAANAAANSTVAWGYESAYVDENNLQPGDQLCAEVTPGGSSDPSGPSLTIEKVVDQDCSGIYPYTACKFTIRIFNTGGTTYTGPLTFTDTVTGPSGITIGGVTLASPLPPGWACNGSQPATCTINSATIPPNGGYITVPLYMTINGAIPPQQNCAVLTAPVSASSCVPMGSTDFDLGLSSSIIETDLALNGATFEFLVSSTPTLANGAQLIFNGSVTTPATFVPPALAPVVVSGTPLWSCGGPWSGFICSLNVTPGAWSGGVIPLRLKVYYETFHVGQPVTFSGQIQMNGNADPVSSNNTTSMTTVLP